MFAPHSGIAVPGISMNGWKSGWEPDCFLGQVFWELPLTIAQGLKFLCLPSAAALKPLSRLLLKQEGFHHYLWRDCTFCFAKWRTGIFTEKVFFSACFSCISGSSVIPTRGGAAPLILWLLPGSCCAFYLYDAVEHWSLASCAHHTCLWGKEGFGHLIHFALSHSANRGIL